MSTRTPRRVKSQIVHAQSPQQARSATSRKYRFRTCPSGRVLALVPILLARTGLFSPRPALQFAKHMTGAIQLEVSLQVVLTLRARSTEAASRRCRNAKRNLIATRPRLEIAVTHSYEKRKHFLTATRNSKYLAGGRCLPEAARIHRKLLSLLVAPKMEVSLTPTLNPPILLF